MVQQDTIRLLRECNAGVKMGVSSIDDVIENVSSSELREILKKSKEHHSSLGNETRKLLNEYGDEGKEPNPMAKSMSWIKTNVKLAVDGSDATVADLLTDGCNMGIKSLSKYLNEYAAADEESKDITKELIKIETQLSNDLRDFL